ncbi:hypothetical protein MKX01_034905 [Papaver californicum]|nr:hypothetical protein MKX01_034905 [Papaver californicum]
MSNELPVCVYKSQPVLIYPEKPTPKCPLYLSNIDNLNFLKYHFELCIHGFSVDEFLKDNTWLNIAWKDNLLFKVTYLSCGGMLMCITMYPCMFDGVGGSKILHDWAHLHANPNLDLPIPPIHNPPLECNTFEALSSHIWRCYVKALNLPSSLRIKLLIPTIMRTNIEPNLPKGYYSNSFVLVCAKTTFNELVTAKINHIVELIQEGKKRVLSNDYVRSAIDITEEKKVQPVMSTTLVMYDWRMLGFHELVSETWCVFLPVIGDSNVVKVLVSVPKKIVHKFETYMMNDFLQKDDKLINGGLKFEGKKIGSRYKK